MSTVQKINFEPVSDIITVQRRDFALADKTLADPMNAIGLVDGEWMTIDSSYKLIRAADIATLGTAGAGGRATLKSFPLWAERGRTDVRAMADVKMPILFMGYYEFDTRIFDATAVVPGAGAAITYVMQPLKVATIVLGTRNYVGLVGSTLADTAPIVGYVTRLPAANGGKLRFINGGRV